MIIQQPIFGLLYNAKFYIPKVYNLQGEHTDLAKTFCLRVEDDITEIPVALVVILSPDRIAFT
jgi:hypothetical protein